MQTTTLPHELPWHPELLRNPRDHGWDYDEPAVHAGTAMWLPPVAEQRRGLIATNAGAWLSPPLVTRPFSFYRLTFSATAERRAYVAAKHLDAAGNELVADHYSAIEPAAEWSRQIIDFRPPPGTVATRIRWETLDQSAIRVRDIRVEPITTGEVARRIRVSTSHLPELCYDPPEERWRQLPSLRRRITDGEKLRLVFLGDSISNDLSNSLFEALLAERSPNVHVEVITSVMGSTGCASYQSPELLQSMVLRHQADGVLIGGISNGTDPRPIASVVEQIRAAGDSDIILLSEAFGWVDHRFMPAWRGFQTPPNSARDCMRRVAREAQLPFLDMAGCIGVWCDRAGVRDWRVFKRDHVHANYLGRMLAARILARFFEIDDA